MLILFLFLPPRPRASMAPGTPCGPSHLAPRSTTLPRRSPSERPRRPTILFELLIILVLILVNGLLAGAEIALVSARGSRMRELLQKGKSSAEGVLRLQRNPERFLATVQVGITVIGATAGAFGGARVAAQIEPALRRIEALEPYAGEISLGIIVVLISYLSIVLGELVPKSLALRSAETYSLLVAKPLLAISTAAKPFVWLLTASSNVVLKLFGDKTNFTETRISKDEIHHLVEEASRVGGSVDPDAGEIASRAIEFGALTAADVMVHRRFVVALPITATTHEVRRMFVEKGHRRVPVFEKAIDDVVGYVSWRDVFRLVAERRPIALREILRPLHVVPETIPAVDLLKEMQKKRSHIAIAVEEHGGMAGIVTMEDLVEELVGDIFSEHDEPQPEPIRKEPGGSFLVQGTMQVRDVNWQLGLELPEPPGGSTIGGLCVILAGDRIPETGEKLTSPDGTVLVVMEHSPRRVRVVRIFPPARKKDQGGAG